MKKLLALLCLCIASLVSAQTSFNVNLIGNIKYGRFTNDVWGYTDADGNDYALVGLIDGVSIVKVESDIIYEIDFVPGVRSIWRDLKTHSHYAYVTNESGDGLDIIDLSSLPDSVRYVTSYDTAFTTAHNLFISNGFAYIAGSDGAGGADILDLTDPESPVLVRRSSFSYFHDIFVRNDTMFASTGGRSSLAIFDVTNKSVPISISEIPFPSGGYSHNSWATEDGNYVMTTEETVGQTVKMWDIRDVNNPTLVDEFLSSPSLLAHNTHIKGDYAFVSHYGDGLRIVDISEPEHLVEVGFYDTHSGDLGGFEGNWGAFPFTNSGYIYATDEAHGLFVVEFNWRRASRLRGQLIDSRTGEPVRNANVEVVDTDQNRISDVNGKYKLGFAEPGSYTIRASKSGYDTTLITIDLVEGKAHIEDIFMTPSTVTEVEDNSLPVLTTYNIDQNYPNPFNAGTTIRYALPVRTHVLLKIYNMVGTEIKSLVDEIQPEGRYEINWDGRDEAGRVVPSGAYFYRITTKGLVQTNKMILMK